MKKISAIQIIFFAICILLLQCSDGGDSNNDKNQLDLPPFSGNNNTTILTGNPIGSNTAVVSDLRKVVAVNLVNSNSYIQIGTAYVFRHSATDEDSLYGIIPITNISSNSLYFIELTTIDYLDGSNQVLESNEFSFVTGSMGVTSGGSYTDTCLAPGETGFVTFIEIPEVLDTYYTKLTSIRISEISAYTDAFYEPDIEIIPQVYEYALPYLYVTLKNTGTRLGYVTFTQYIMLDSSNLPLMWGFLNYPTWSSFEDLILDVNQQGIVQAYGYYDGTASVIMVKVSYDIEPFWNKTNMRDISNIASEDECLKQMNSQRNINIKNIKAGL